MILKNIIKDLDIISVIGATDVEISCVVYDSNNACENCLFVAITGFVSNGHNYISNAINKGATAVIVSEDIAPLGGITIIKVAECRDAFARVSANFFDNPSEKLALIGITGTKGKTTVTYMIRSIFSAQGVETGLIGSVEKFVGSVAYDLQRTTPEAYETEKMLAKMVESDIKFCIMEVASQGIKLKRTKYLNFNVGGFTNLFEDHIAPFEHPDMEDYFETKKKLFKICDVSFINIDIEEGQIIYGERKNKAYTYGIEEKADFVATDILYSSEGTKFNVRVNNPDFTTNGCEVHSFSLSMPGTFNIYNALLAISICRYYDVAWDVIREGLKTLAVKGRLERVSVMADFSVIIDHAHNKGSLINVICDLKKNCRGKIICVFGAGGDRAPDRRFGMGYAAGLYADTSIITSDNPRTECPSKIIAKIKEGMKEGLVQKGVELPNSYYVIENRKDAIRFALGIAKKDDIVLLAGKGDELYQDFGSYKIDFDERVIVKDIIKELSMGDQSV